MSTDTHFDHSRSPDRPVTPEEVYRHFPHNHLQLILEMLNRFGIYWTKTPDFTLSKTNGQITSRPPDIHNLLGLTHDLEKLLSSFSKHDEMLRIYKLHKSSSTAYFLVGQELTGVFIDLMDPSLVTPWKLLHEGIVRTTPTSLLPEFSGVIPVAPILHRPRSGQLRITRTSKQHDARSIIISRFCGLRAEYLDSKLATLEQVTTNSTLSERVQSLRSEISYQRNLSKKQIDSFSSAGTGIYHAHSDHNMTVEFINRDYWTSHRTTHTINSLPFHPSHISFNPADYLIEPTSWFPVVRTIDWDMSRLLPDSDNLNHSLVSHLEHLAAKPAANVSKFIACLHSLSQLYPETFETTKLTLLDLATRLAESSDHPSHYLGLNLKLFLIRQIPSLPLERHSEVIRQLQRETDRLRASIDTSPTS